MDVETALNFVDDLIYKQTGQNLNDLERDIFRGVWENKTYKIIAEQIYSTDGSVRHPATALWKKISGVLGETVSNKGNKIKSVIERKYREIYGNQSSESVSHSNNSDNKQDACTPAIAPNKQDACTTEYDPNFVGREDAIAHLKNLIQQGKKVIQIIASGGTGKTVLAQKYLNDHCPKVLEFKIAQERKDIASVESLLEYQLGQLGEEPGREFMVSLDRLKQKLKTEKIGILIDNIEPALDSNGMFINDHRSYVELLKVLTDISVKSITFITSRERLGEGLALTLYNLPSLTISAWGEYWQNQKINTDNPIFSEIYKAFGGNALAMKVLCETIINDFQGDLVAYWKDHKIEDSLMIEKAVKNLIKEQFERLKMIDLSAYNLLCRLGCYRYQDVPTVPEQGLFCLLWDVTENKQKKEVIKVLKERALVEFNNGDYWLHPVIREEAIERLRNSDDWENTNKHIAWFLEKKAEHDQKPIAYLESIYHYHNIADMKSINNLFKVSRTIFQQDSFLKLFSEIDDKNIEIVKRVKNIVESVKNVVYNPIYLMNIVLGTLYFLKGEINKALECYTVASDRAKKNKNISNRFTALANITLCQIYLFEISKAQETIKIILENLDELDEKYYNQNTDMFPIAYCLYFVVESIVNSNNCLTQYEQCIKYFENDELLRTSKKEWNKLIILLALALGHKNIALQTTNKTKKENTIKTALYYIKQISERSKPYNYQQFQGIIWNYKAELYRIQNDFETALTDHQQSIEILDKIGAECDLAEAYFQLALTYQQMKDQDNSKIYFNKALYLWGKEQIDAPKQIERVLKAMNLSSDQT